MNNTPITTPEIKKGDSLPKDTLATSSEKTIEKSAELKHEEKEIEPKPKKGLFGGITPKKKEAPTKAGIFDKLSVQEKIDFARHLAMVVKAGLPVYEGLTIIGEQTESKTLAKIIDRLRTDINNGRFLADSLEQFNRLFGSFFINIIRVGESSGTLAQNLLYLAEELQKSKALESKVKSAMVYPMVILVATLGISAFLTFYIFPKLLPVLEGLNVDLPASTDALISTVEFLKSYGIHLVVGIALFTIIAKFVLRKSEMVRYLAHRAIFLIPAVGPLSIGVNVSNFARVLSLLLKSGVKIIEAITITSNTFTNLVYKQSLIEANEEIRKGGQLATYLNKKREFFPPLVSGMIRVGESTGNLEENLSYLAEYYEGELDSKLRGLTSLLEPIMLLIMGLLVGFVAISIITPIYSLSSGVK